MMKRFLTPILAAALLVIALVVIPVPRTGAQAGLVSSVITRMQRNQQTLKTLSADISMDKYNSQIRDSDKFYGTVKYIPIGGRSAFVRLEWTKPQHEILVVANGAYTLCRLRMSMCYVGTTNSIKSDKDSDVLALLNMSTTQLQARFGELQDMRDETLWGGVATTHFKAVPKNAASYNYIEVWVDASGMPVQTKMVEKNNDSTTVRLTNVTKNQAIPKTEFDYKPDPSFKKIKS
jgi:outer membrane lipoprotein-sorting protein